MLPLPPLETELLRRLVNKNTVVLDIGANQGSYTCFLATIAKEVHAFEPERNNLKLLIQNTHSLKNVNIHYTALSDKNGYTYLHLCPTDTGMHRLYPSKWCEGGKIDEVHTWALDSYTRVSNIISNSKISFIKIDIEGYEYHAIRGMTKLIKRDKPTIMMEWHPPTLEEAGTNPKEFYNFMKDKMGYTSLKHCLLDNGNRTINTYEELDNYTRDIPAINILWQ